jgi:tetratricopeptide (TPR) repeat protein
MNIQTNGQANGLDQLFRQAFLSHQSGKFAEAEAGYRKVLRLAPKDVDTLYLLGTACSQQCKHDEARKLLERALAITPDHPEALNNLGLTLIALGKEEEAARRFEAAIARRPDYGDAYNNLAHALQRLGRMEEAEAHARRALQSNPGDGNAYYNLGLALLAQDRFKEAEEAFLRGLQFRPDLAAAYHDLAGVYKIWGRLDDALVCLDRAIQLNPRAFNSHNNRGAIYEELGRLDEALAEYQRATELNPDDKAGQWNAALTYLRQGILDKGWEAHDLRIPLGIVHDRFPYANWDGAPLADKSLLVFAEQGVGDELCYASCIPDVIEQARHVVIECDARLAPLYARSFPKATVFGTRDRMDISWLLTAPKIDVQSPVGSLPRYVRPTLDHFPAQPAYLFADPARVEYWRSRMALLGAGLKVGICWRSGVTKGERHKQYSQLTEWGNIFQVPGVQFVNLQYDECSEELRAAEEMFGIQIANFTELNMKNELDETAALITALDLVISAGTAVSEMSGALGVESYRLDVYGKPMDALGTGRSPWHPTMRLFGQSTVGDWSTPLALAAEALQERVNGSRQEERYLRLADGTELAVSPAYEDLLAYVMQEQQGWFDAEHAFLSKALNAVNPNARVVDLGCESGLYAVPLARHANAGKVWAMAAQPAELRCLMQSRERNGLGQRMTVVAFDGNASLDAEMDRHGLDNIDLVLLPSAMSRRTVLEGGARFFRSNAPLVMFGIDGTGDEGAAVAQWFLAAGYELYCHVPGLDALVPAAAFGNLDGFRRNVFACPSERAAGLEARGVLVRLQVALPSMPGIDVPAWQELLRPLPYAGEAIAAWLQPEQRARDWEVYWMGLNLYAWSRDVKRSMAERFAALQAAANVLGTLVQEQATFPRILSLSRVLVDLGQREIAVGLLNQVGGLLEQGMTCAVDEPCLALLDSYAAMSPGARGAEWATAMLLAARERWRAFSTFFSGMDALTALEEAEAAGFADAFVTNAIKLIRGR